MNEVRWLSGREQEIWRAYMTTSLELAAHLDQQLRRDASMPATYYEILVCLSETPGRAMRMSRLATLSKSSRSRLSHAVSALEKAGWVLRLASDTDRRGSVAQLTDAGFAALKAAAPGHVTEVRCHLFDVLTPGQAEALHDISVAIRNGLPEACLQSRAETGESRADLDDPKAGADGCEERAGAGEDDSSPVR